MSDVTIQMKDCQVFEGNFKDCVFTMPGVSPRKKEESPKTSSEFVDLRFFDPSKFGTMESQDRLRQAIMNVLPRMDADSGRDWVAPYIAYHYYIGRELTLKGHSDFFSDIDRLLPGVLTKVKKDGKGDKRYKVYTDLLRLECPCWFILNECLPPMKEWTSTTRICIIMFMSFCHKIKFVTVMFSTIYGFFATNYYYSLSKLNLFGNI